VHFHSLIPDGVFDLSGDGPARCNPISAPPGCTDSLFADG